MYVKVLDSNPILATKLIKYKKNNEEMEYLIFNDIELDSFLVRLNKENISYIVEDVLWEQEIIDKVKNRKFANRSELIDFIQNDTEPESQIIDSLKKENEGLKNKLSQHEDVIDFLIQSQGIVIKNKTT